MNYVTSPKQILFGRSARNKIRAGVKKISDAVTATMGPGGRNVLYRTPLSVFPASTKDGVSVAKMVFLSDEEENLASLTVQQACMRQLRESGDGTTLTCLLAHTFLEYLIKTQKYDELEIAIHRIINRITHTATPCITIDDLENVAYVSCNSDVNLARTIAKAVDSTRKGIVQCERSMTSETSLEFVAGYSFSSGIEYIEFVNNNAKGNFEAKNPLFLITDHEIAYIQQLLPFLEKYSKQCDPASTLVIVCPSLREEAGKFIIKAKSESKLNIVFMKPSGIGEERQNCLRDLAAITGARFIFEESGIRIQDITPDMLGTAERIVSDRTKTIVLENKTKSRKLERVTELEALIQQLEPGYRTDLAELSIAKLQGQIAILKIGGHSETEQSEILDRADDAIRACRSALEEGVVTGGGCALVHAAYSLEMLDSNIRRLFLTPITKILKNSGHGLFEITKIIFRCKRNHEYTYADLTVVDPAKVIRTALLNAFSVAKQLARVDVTLTPIKQETEK